MNKVQNIINELHAEVDKLGSTKLREWMHEKVDELDAYLTWTEVKAHSGPISEEDDKVKANAKRRTEDEWFKLLEKHKNNHLIIERDADGNFVAEVREARGALVLYLAPDLRTMTGATYEAFCETMGSII